MRNTALLISFVVLLLVIAGCKSDGGSGASLTSAFVGGTTAMKISFLPNSPPAEVTDKLVNQQGFPFKATVTVENVGEYNVQAQGMLVSMSGFFPSDFSITNPENIRQFYPAAGEFRGVSKDPDGNKITGDIAQISFPASGDFMYSKELPGNQEFPFRAEICYPYQTKVVSQVCLMKDFTGRDQPICNPTGSRQVSNSGAPIHITSVSQSTGGKDKLILSFTVKKVGQSELFLSGCADDFSNKDRVTVDINTGLQGAGSSLRCLGLLNGREIGATAYSGAVLLNEGTASFTCIQTLGTSDRVDSLKTFELSLTYSARDSVTTNVIVKHLI